METASKIDYSEKVAFITGGSKGIGLGLAVALAKRGAKLALIGTDVGALDAAAARFDRERTIALALDVRDSVAWTAAVERVEGALGPIDFLALNAGAQGGRRPIEEISPEEWQWVWDVNVGGVYNGLRACLPGMKQRGRPAHVLTTSSIAALLPRATASAYGASKAASLAIMESLRLELADTPIGTSVFCPALVRTEFANTNERHAPQANPDTFAFMRAFEGQGLDPIEVGRFVLDAIDSGAFYIFSHLEFLDLIAPRLSDVQKAFAEQTPVASRHFGGT
jgi:NADP-dependent 3-hydroxy acid dehydrogenase YdfG